MLRVLKGERRKYTVLILFKTGEEVEFQTDNQPNIRFDQDARINMLSYDAGGTGYTPVCDYSLVLLCRCEKNPDV